MTFDLTGLHPELRDYVVHDHPLGLTLSHPLVRIVGLLELPSSPDVPIRNEIERANAIYERKLEFAREAYDNGQWDDYVFLHERPYRLDALLEVIDWHLWYMPPLWALVGEVWRDTENAWCGQRAWLEIWRDDCPKRYRAMSKHERLYLRKLPEVMTVWRGVYRQEAIRGLSWTLRRSKAEWFARRGSGPPMIVKGHIQKSAVFAYFCSRKEAEVVLDPDCVNVVEIQNA